MIGAAGVGIALGLGICLVLLVVAAISEMIKELKEKP